MPESRNLPSWLPGLLLAAFSLTLTLALFAGVEGALRLLDLGEPPAASSRLKYQRIYLPLLEPVERPDGDAVLVSSDVRLPYQSIRADKSARALRVITFGGSATAGLGFSPNATFARGLERALTRAYPEREIEVMNLGIVALSSSQVKVLVADACRNYDPDVVVVYSGNNEFLEIHAEKFAAAHASILSSTADTLMQTNLYRLAGQLVRGPPRKPSLEEQDFSNADLRVTQDSIVKEIDLTADEVAEVIGRYQANIEEIAAVAAETQTPLVLMTVASNWKYRGRDDLPENWLKEVLGSQGSQGPERLREAAGLLEQRSQAGTPLERWNALYRLARANELLGDYPSARNAYREAMNRDPHLRRALDSMADRVREIASSRAIPLVDAIDVLSGAAEDGIVGFGEFYDYVHFTPRGALLIAAELFRELRRSGILPPADSFDLDRYIAEQLGQLASLREDPLSVDDWLGLGFDPSSVSDRDLWKYERMLSELDRRLEADPQDFRALVYRGNASYFRLDGATAAARDYEAALRVRTDDPAVLANLAKLRSNRRP